jgi:hypothetical protein
MKLALALIPLALVGCAGGEAIRTSANTMIVQAGAAPACGPGGALRVAQKVAAIETIRAGFDRFIITGTQAESNIAVVQGPGTANTTISGSRGFYQAQTTFTPGPTYTLGSHDRGLAIVMFRNSDPGASNAVDARETLGKDWAELVKTGVRTCL